ncbi:hypothetical protein H7171_03590 [Candidatus Saccharibacteria bacterium]|nr:hypothetical protein [Candidatus Saccharibacteria bacterium]
MRSTSTSSTRTYMPPTDPVEPPKTPKRKLKLPQPKTVVSKKQLPWVLLAILALVSIFLFVQYEQAKSKLQNNGQQYYAAQTVRLGKLILLPTNEVPTIVTVKDVAKLQGQKFYVQAKDGDITFVYSQQQKAILYRPSANLIINVAPVNVTPTPGTGR